MEAAFDVFVAYRLEGAAARVRASDFARQLEGLGLRPWIAEDRLEELKSHDEVLAVLRTLPGAVALVSTWPTSGWYLEEIAEIGRLRESDPPIRFVQVLLPGATALSSVEADATFTLRDERNWEPHVLRAIAAALGAPPEATSRIGRTPSVDSVAALPTPRTSFELVAHLLRTHRYPVGSATADDVLAVEAEDALRKPAADWIEDAAHLFDPFKTPVLHGQLLIDGLARLDEALENRLEELGALAPIRAAISPPPETQLRHKPDSVGTLTDYPADADKLGRDAFARILARRIASMRQEEVEASQHRGREDRRGGPFLLHLYGPWGTGKTSLLRFMADQLGDGEATLERDDDQMENGFRARFRSDRTRPRVPAEWIVVDFNAWQHQRIVPPWWWLMSAVHRQGSKALWRLNKRRWILFKTWDISWRLRGAAPALLVLGVGAALAWLVLHQKWLGGLAEMETVVKAASAVVALALTIWGGARALGRWLVVGSPRAADAYINNARDPLETLSRRFKTLVRRLHYPVAIFIDDLDRCQGKYVVELLEGVQTLFKDVPVAYVVAADREWLCQSYATAYADFCATTGEPGRPLGYLFLEKTFQLSAAVPSLSSTAQQDYLQGLLKVARPTARDQLTRTRAKAEEEMATMHDESRVQEKVHAAQHLPAMERQAVYEAAALQLAHPDVERRIQHTLQPFAPLLEPNPRSMKRLVNAYGVARAVEILRGMSIGVGEHSSLERIALWTILALRWPLLAEYLTENPDAADRMREGLPPPDEPDWLRQLWTDPRVLAVLRGEARNVRTVLDADAIRVCIGKD